MKLMIRTRAGQDRWSIKDRAQEQVDQLSLSGLGNK